MGNNHSNAEELLIQPTRSLRVGTDARIDGDVYTKKLFKVQNDHGYLVMGPQNDYWAHIYSDRAKFAFNKPISVLGNEISGYESNSLSLKANHNSSKQVRINNQGDVIANGQLCIDDVCLTKGDLAKVKNMDQFIQTKQIQFGKFVIGPESNDIAFVIRDATSPRDSRHAFFGNVYRDYR